MIERFNFYDLYGYLIPGVALIIVALVPFPILGHSLPAHTLPEGELSALVLGVVVAYVIGHFLQSLAHSAFPSKINGTYPSTSLLDPTDNTFSDVLKQRVAAKALKLFELELKVEKVADGQSGRQRQDAFFLARSGSNPKESGSYSEQHQGLYSLMRGLAVVTALAAFYTIGWTLAPWSTLVFPATIGLAAATITGLVFSALRLVPKFSDARKAFDRWTIAALCLAALAGGCLAGQCIATFENEAPLFVLIGFYLMATLRFFAMYRFFSIEFAQAIWRSFAARSDS